MGRPEASAPAAAGRFTGRHMALLMAGFFGTVIAVNLLLANLAVSSFSGVVVQNAYVASQGFNGLLSAAKAEQALGWSLDLRRGRGGAVRFTLTDASGAPLRNAAVRAVADHPLGTAAPVSLLPREVSPGVYEAALAGGRWHVGVEVRAQGHVWHAQSDAL